MILLVQEVDGLSACNLQVEKRQQEEEVQRMKQIIYPAIGVIISVLLLYTFLAEFCHPLTLPPERPPMRL